MEKITSIQIEGFRSIRKMEPALVLRPINVLIGANGSGKSNFLSLFELIPEVAADDPADRLNEKIQKMGGVELLYGGPKTTTTISIRLGHDCGFSLICTDDNRLVLLHRGITRNVTKEELGSEPQVEKLMLEAVPTLSAKQMYYHFHDTSPTAAIMRATDMVNHPEMLLSDGRNLAAVLYSMKKNQPEHYQNIRRTVQIIAPTFSDFSLKPDKNEQTIRLAWRECGFDDIFGAYRLSDGTLRFICLATLLLQPEPPPVIVIDEPELGLHPHSLSLFAELVKRASVNSQVILATHSVDLVNEFEPDDVVVVDREDGQSVFNRLQRERLEEWLEDYSLGEIWMKGLAWGDPTT